MAKEKILLSVSDFWSIYSCKAKSLSKVQPQHIKQVIIVTSNTKQTGCSPLRDLRLKTAMCKLHMWNIEHCQLQWLWKVFGKQC